MSSYREIGVEKNGQLVELVLRRPENHNAMSAAMGAEIAEAVAAINADREARVVLIRGEGKSFAAGGDFAFIEERSQDSGEHNRRQMIDYYRRFLSVHQLVVPTVAAVHGAAIGAGLCFAMACDVRLAATGTRFGVNFVRLGLHPGMGATYFLPRLIGPSRANELLLTGKRFSAEQALNWGLVSAVHPAETLCQQARAVAAEIAACAPLAVARTKASLQRSLHRTLDEALLAEATAQALDFQTADVREGLTAARERREPSFEGR
jgi:enoyl-CoA hydratase/carnithine racemase